MSELTDAIDKINASASATTRTTTFFDDVGTADDNTIVTNPNNGKQTPSIKKQVKDQVTPELQKFEVEHNAQMDKFDKEFYEQAQYKPAIPWAATTAVSDKFQLYSESTNRYRPNPSKIPFTTGATIADDIANDLWITYAEATLDQVNTIANAGDSQIVGGKIWPVENRSAAIGDAGLVNVEIVKDAPSNTLYKIYNQFGQQSVSGTIDAIDFAAQTITVSGTDYFLINAKYDDMNPSAWGVKANNGADDWQAMTNFMTFYRFQVVAHVESGMVPSIAAPIMQGVANRILLSKPLHLYGYLNADFGKTSFGRHPSWSEPAGTYLLTSTDLYKANFGGMSFYNTDYALEIVNANLDQGLIIVDDVHFAKCNFALRTNCQSSTTKITNFSFDNCPRMATIDRGDQVLFEGGSMYQGPLTGLYDCSIEVNNAYVIIKHVIGVPSEFHTGQEIAWINNNAGGRIETHDMRFGAEFGGCAAVNQFGKFQKEGDVDPTPVGVKIKDSQCYSTYKTGVSKSCIIRLFEVPNFIDYKDNRGMTLTDEVITWGENVSNKYSKVQELLDLLSGYSFEYRGNLQIQSGSDYAGELSPLFAPDDYSPLSVSSVPVAGLINCDTRIKPEASGVYQLTVKGRVNPTDSALFESSYSCLITIGTTFEDPKVVRKATLTEIAKSPGGRTADKQLSAQVRFWNGSSQSESADITDNLWRIRIQVIGWESGQEGAGFEGVINRIL